MKVLRAVQRGGAVVETLIVMPVLVMVIAGAFQAAMIYEAKATLNHATLQAARSGAVNNANINSIRAGLARGLLPLYSPDSSLGGLTGTLTTKVLPDVATSSIRILNPTTEAFQDFGVNVHGVREIPNDRLYLRPTTTGSRSGLTIQDANLLRVQVRYGYELKVPVVRWVFRLGLRLTRPDLDNVERAMVAANRLPMIATATVRMQTPARQNSAVMSRNNLPGAGDLPRQGV
ncbi:MAG TPA: TadE family protein [Steroidobacter sp.]|uniref:TadE/TadG family type IV pilus assembly protein n=1 Tax=Steroidobacter sp. TaxID=1978227 RepID=UPI002ED87FB0